MPVSQQMFFCAPQKAYMLTESCQNLRSRPLGKAPGGAPTRPRSCENCGLSDQVDARTVPTVTLSAFMNGSLPAKTGE